jgi:hypothetical protein
MPRTLTLALASIAAPLMLTGCAMSDARAQADALNPEQLALLERNLGGKVAGEPINCISNAQSAQTIRVSDDILLYRVSGNLVYRNDLRSSCPGLARDSDVIVTDVRGIGPCRGDIIRLVDRTSGIQGPACSLGSFTPYRTRREGGR